MNKKIWVGVVVIVVALVTVIYFGTQNKKQKVYHIGILSGVDPFASMADGFKAKMTELGYVEGQNVVYDFQKANPDPTAYQRVLNKFVADKVDLIFTFPTEAAVEAKNVTQKTNIPVVFASAAIEDINLVDSIARPGGNITGVRYPSPELTVKRFELLQELMPNLKRLWLIYDANYPATKSAMAALRPAAKASGVTLVEDHISTVADIQAVLSARAKSSPLGVDAILIMPEVTVQSPDGWPLVSKFAAEHNLPIAGSLGFEAEAGAVFSYIPDNITTGKLAAPLADRIFKGIPAGTIPIVSPESDLNFNYPLAQKLGLKITETFLQKADKIIR